MGKFDDLFFKIQNGNDVRGAAIQTENEKKTLCMGLVVFIAKAFGDFLVKKTGKTAETLRVGVGHDSRITASELMKACFHGLSDVNVYDCGLISTPAMFQSTVLPESDFDGAIMLTASHLPFNRNGMKFFTKDGGIEKDELHAILCDAARLADEYGDDGGKDILNADRLPCGKGKVRAFDMVSVYAETMKRIIREGVRGEDEAHPLTGLHIVVDAGNGAAGFFATKILEPLGANTSGSVFLEPDGTFPNHIPNPEDASAMEAARKATVESNADLGVIFDCDGDRGAVVFADGTEVNRNALIALLASIVSETHPGSTVVTDSVTSDELAEFLTDKLKMKHLRYKRGYKNVIGKGLELNAAGEDCQLAIETSGHGAFKENYFSDDGAYIAVKIIIKMAQLRKAGKRIESLIEDLGSPAEATERRFRITAEDFRSYGSRVLDDFLAYVKAQDGFEIVEPNYEGIRVAFTEEGMRGWALLRMSLHDPVMPMNVEAKEAGGLAKILAKLDEFFARYEGLCI